ncbi:putative metal-binding protein [Burkholderia contaminans]|uniref:putative metal-binding protein n=1 Tax=Burkholderia contaminans TaxID=488447 RepID=UPI0034641B80
MREAVVHEALSRSKFEREVAFLTPLFLKSRGWIVNEAVFPVLDITFSGTRSLRLKLDCAEWDELPPAAVLLDGLGQPLQPPIPGGIFHGGPHSRKAGPFICMRGFREYHTHDSHLHDVWSTYRGEDGNGLIGLLDQVSRTWRRTYPQ